MSPAPTAVERQRFEAARAAVADSTRNAEETRVSLLAAREAVNRVTATAQLRAARQKQLRDRQELAAARNTALTNDREAFQAFTDPRASAPMLNDSIPFLLFPLRIETRFGSPIEQGVQKHQLWVRVYPDDCEIDSFEPLPSETEIESAQRYWVNMWKAHGIEAKQRGAWRSLVASHGSGRAAWLEANYRPLNLAAMPNIPGGDSLVLAVKTEAPIVDPEAAAIRAYWKAVWLAAGVSAAVDQAAASLRAAVGSETRARALIEDYEPVNLADDPPPGVARANVNLTVEFVEFPKTEDQAATRQSWSQAARSLVLPDRLMLLLYPPGGGQVIEKLGNRIPCPLIVGPDPLAPEADQIRQKDGEIEMGADLKWLTDFDYAVKIGMGFRVDLTEAAARQGFDRLLVVGLRVSADEKEGKRLLEELLTHHRDGSSGFGLVPQGTPTNNTESESSGFTRSEEADRTFDERLHPGAPLRANAAWGDRLDGEWLADMLGIDPTLLDSVAGSRNSDQREAQAMNAALWPATLGYGLETMMHPVFNGDDVDRVRWFYEHFVTGRGLLPAIRLGKQPYGILPTAATSRLQWPSVKDLQPVPGASNPAGFRATLAHLATILNLMDTDWGVMSKSVSTLSSPGDPHKVLLDIIGLHPTSVEFYQRYAESLEDLYNRMRFYGWGSDFLGQLAAFQYQVPGMLELQRLGYSGNELPDILNRFFIDSSNLLTGPLIDDLPLSESAKLQDVTGGPQNYIEWLLDGAATSLDKVRQEIGFTGNKPPKALLYLLLRHALLQSYWDSGLRLGESRGVIDAAAMKEARRESPFIHIQHGRMPSESRWGILYQRDARITGDPAVRVGDYITGIIGADPAADRLARVLAGLDVLKDLSSARLERLFAEHLDTCTYRHDAWQQGLVHYALGLMRYQATARGVVAAKGIYLGAFGWLEEVRPRARQLQPVLAAPGLDASFHDPVLPPLLHDSGNGGYIHAASLNQAVAAAVLRNGYLANATQANPGAFAVNLSSDRVRLALSFLEGVRQGQSLGALLGYQLERGLHDGYALGEVDEHIYALRKKFPLVADRHPDTASPPTAPIEAIEARNVVDGLQLVEYVKNMIPRSYPFGFTDLPPGDGGKGAAIDREVDRLIDTTDAIADLKISDGLYHAVQSNYDAVAATLESSGGGQLPPEPAIIQTPRSGRTVTHRVGLQLRAGLNEDNSAVAGVAVTPRARAEPAVNAWLADMMPAPDKVAATVQWYDPISASLQTRTVSQLQLGLQPIDLLYVASLETDQAMSELDDRILKFAHENFVARPDSAVTIAYRTPIAGSLTFFETAPLVRALRPLLLHSRPLRPTDATAQGAASSAMDTSVRIDSARITKVQSALAALRDDIVTFRDALDPLHVEPIDIDTIVAGLDTGLTDFMALLVRASSFGIGDTGWGFIMEFKRAWFAAAFELAGKLAARFVVRLADCDNRLSAYDLSEGGMTDRERFRALAAAEQTVRAKVTTPPPGSAGAYRTAVGDERDDFAARLNELQGILNIDTKEIEVLRAAMLAALAGPPKVADLDPEMVDLVDLDKLLVKASADLLSRAKRLIKAIEGSRLNPAVELILDSTQTADDAQRARLLTDAAKSLLGPDALVLPEFKLGSDQGATLQAAYDASLAGDLLTYQRDVRKTPEPVDTWLYGIARVREKMQTWEQVVMLSGAFGATEPDLVPVQLPWTAGEHWLGLEYPSTFLPSGERLCYTAHFAQPLDATKWQCGLLIDDWTEVIPATQETTGLAFHYDRPNAEAPQALLLVTPPAFAGSWQWQDVVDAVNETLDQAKKRAVEPAHIDQTPYARFLPATVMAATLYQVSIMTNLARNNEFYAHLEAATIG